MTPIQTKLDELKKLCDEAAQGLSFEAKDEDLQGVFWQMNTCLKVTRTEAPRLIQALKVALEAMTELTHWDPGNDSALIIEAQDKIESILNGEEQDEKES